MYEGVCEGINTKCIGKKYIRPRYSDIAFFPVPCIAKKHLCLGVSGLCLGGSGWGLRVSGYELMQNILAQIYIGHVCSYTAFYSSARLYVKTLMSGWCLDGVCGCLDHI